MAVFPIASSLINRPTTVHRALLKRNIVKQCYSKKQIQNFCSTISRVPKFQKFFDRFFETIKIMKGIK